VRLTPQPNRPRPRNQTPNLEEENPDEDEKIAQENKIFTDRIPWPTPRLFSAIPICGALS